MKSYASNLMNFKNHGMDTKEWKVELTSKDELLKQAKEDVCKKYGVNEEATAADVISSDNVVFIKCESTLPKYNKPMVPVNVGKGYFNQAIEDQLIGMKLKETKDVLVDNETVKITVLKFKVKHVPELTEEMIVKEEIHGVRTIEAFEEHTYTQHYNMAVMSKLYPMAIQPIMVKVVNNTTYTIDEVEYADFEKEMYQNMLRPDVSDGINDEMKLNFSAAMICDSMDAYESMKERAVDSAAIDEIFKEALRVRFKQILMSKEYVKVNDIPLNKETFENQIQEFIKMGPGTEEEIRNFFTYERYLSEAPHQLFMQDLQSYVIGETQVVEV